MKKPRDDEIELLEYLFSLGEEDDVQEGGGRLMESDNNDSLPEPRPVTHIKADGTTETRPMNEAELTAWRQAEHKEEGDA